MPADLSFFGKLIALLQRITIMVDPLKGVKGRKPFRPDFPGHGSGAVPCRRRLTLPEMTETARIKADTGSFCHLDEAEGRARGS
ncbi:MAG: hypothetical protein ABS910_13550 [Arthrobacter sp.]